MDSENDSVFNDCSDEIRESEFNFSGDEDLPPKQKRAFVKMLAKIIRCAIPHSHSINQLNIAWFPTCFGLKTSGVKLIYL